MRRHRRQCTGHDPVHRFTDVAVDLAFPSGFHRYGLQLSAQGTNSPDKICEFYVLLVS